MLLCIKARYADSSGSLVGKVIQIARPLDNSLKISWNALRY
jgi:hypothetical protein